MTDGPMTPLYLRTFRKETSVADIKRNDNGDVIRVAVDEFRGKDYLDIRCFYKDKTGELKPTRKGVSIPVELAEVVIGAALKEMGKK